MDIVLVTRDRPLLTEQTIRSLRENAADWSRHRLVVVFDANPAETIPRAEESGWQKVRNLCTHFDVPIITTGKQLGVGGAKNFGANHSQRQMEIFNKIATPLEVQHHANGLLMFVDNDMFMLPGWDRSLELSCLADIYQGPGLPDIHVVQLGGWKHPFHVRGRGWGPHAAAKMFKMEPHDDFHEVDAVTGNCFVIRWSDWLKYGPFDANAIGPGQSEDYALSQKIKAGGGLVATLDPPVAIHCGLVNSIGEPATGWREMAEMAKSQLRAMSESERAEVKLEVPVDAPAPHVHGPEGNCDMLCVEEAQKSQQLHMYISDHPERFIGITACTKCGSTVYNDPTHPRAQIVRSQYAPGSQIPAEEGTQRLNDAAVEMGLMHPTSTPTSDDGLPTDDNVWAGLGADKAWPVGLNVGSGQRRFQSTEQLRWINIDSQRVLPDRIPDIVCNVGVQPLPFKDGVMQYVVLHQVLEHFGCGESAPMLRECWRVLAPGGSLIVTVPDMRALAGRWLGGELTTQLFMTNVYGAYMGDEADRHRWGGDCESWTEFLVDLFGNQRCNEDHACGSRDCTQVVPFDWRDVPGADIARDWWILGIEVVKPS